MFHVEHSFFLFSRFPFFELLHVEQLFFFENRTTFSFPQQCGSVVNFFAD